MPEQLIFTSTPTGIQPGRSGFQVVAQHEGINNRLIVAIEKESTYEFPDSSQALPVICKHTKFDFGEERYSVLSRIQSCGIDFTGRPNHIAHHLIFNEKEVPNCPPTALFTLWKGWREKWGKPRYLGEWDRINYENEAHPFSYLSFALPAKTWYTYTNDQGCAALPLFAEREMIAFPVPEGKEDALIWLYLESQSLMSIRDAWQITFTNYLSENDNPLRFNWVGLPKVKAPAQLSYDCDVMDVFTLGTLLVAPQHELAEKARTPPPPSDKPEQKKTSAVSIAPIEDPDYVQDEMVLAEEEQESSEDSNTDFIENVGSLFGRPSNDNLDDLFAEKEERIEFPNLNLRESDSDFIEKRSLYRTFLPFLRFLGVAAILGLLVLLSPYVIELMNWTTNPTSVEQPPTRQEIEQNKRAQTARLDPASRFASQLGEIDSILQNKQFLLARAYLNNYRDDPERSATEEFGRLEQWFENQKTILEGVNRESAILEKDIAQKKVLTDFAVRIAKLYSEIGKLATDLQPALEGNLKKQETIYREWLNQVHLRTENVPTFFIPISKENRNPEITFSHVPQKVIDWMAEFDRQPNTSQLEHIQVQLSPFKGLNQFELNSENALKLSLWKQNDRSLLTYLDGQIDVIEIISKAASPDDITLAWRFQQGELKANTKNIGIFPEPPIILSFLNTETDHSMNIVMMGGVSREDTAPAEIPLDFIQLVPGEYRFKLLDPVLREKLNLFLLPSDQFLEMRSPDNHYRFAWNSGSSDFTLYESNSLESGKVKAIQNQIAQEQKTLNDLDRKETICRSVAFIEDTPLGSLGSELLQGDDCPPHLRTFATFIEEKPDSYFQYLREILIQFADRYTLIRPAIMQQWLAYPQNRQPDSKGAIYDYRNLLLRTSKRFRSLLEEDDPTALENWRSFVTNLEFWLLGEHQEQLLDILSLYPNEIKIAQDTDIEALEKQIQEKQALIAELQASLEDQSNLAGIHQINQWYVEIASLQSNTQYTPLLLFQ